MIMAMNKDVSIAAARDNLPRLVHEVEGGAAIRFLRRGKPVAVVISLQEYERLQARRRGFYRSLMSFRKSHDLRALDIVAAMKDVRDPGPGPSASW